MNSNISKRFNTESKSKLNYEEEIVNNNLITAEAVKLERLRLKVDAEQLLN